MLTAIKRQPKFSLRNNDNLKQNKPIYETINYLKSWADRLAANR